MATPKANSAMPADLDAIGQEVWRRHVGDWQRLPTAAAPGEVR